MLLSMAQPRTLPYSRPAYSPTDYYMTPTAAVGYGSYTSPISSTSCPYPTNTGYCYQPSDITTSPSYDQPIVSIFAAMFSCIVLPYLSLQDSPPTTSSTLPSPQTPSRTPLSPASTATAEETGTMSEHYDASYDGQQYGDTSAPTVPCADKSSNNGYIYSPSGYVYTSSPSQGVYAGSTTTPSLTSCYFSNYPSLAVATNDSCSTNSTYHTYGPSNTYFTHQPYSSLQDYTSSPTVGLSNGYWRYVCMHHYCLPSSLLSLSLAPTAQLSIKSPPLPRYPMTLHDTN